MAISSRNTSALISGIAALVVGFSVAAPAHADDTQDQIFLTSLGNRGITCSALPGCAGNDQLLGLGRAICTDLGISGDPVSVARSLVANQGFSTQQAAGVVGSAVGAYCNQWVSVLRQAAGN